MSLLTRTVVPSLAGDMQTGNALANLAIARGGKLDDATALVYTKQLEDLDPALVERACVQLANEPRAAYETTIPAVGTIRAQVAIVAREVEAAERALKLLPMPARESDEPTYFCLDCKDEPNGWRLFWCPGVPLVPSVTADSKRLPIYVCGRHRNHYAHTYSERCACLSTNPVIARAKELMARHSARPQKAAR